MRLQKFEAGEWLAVIDDALLDIEKDRKRGGSRRITCIGDDIEDQEKHNLESCVHKILSGDTLTGHRVTNACFRGQGRRTCLAPIETRLNDLHLTGLLSTSARRSAATPLSPVCVTVDGAGGAIAVFRFTAGGERARARG